MAENFFLQDLYIAYCMLMSLGLSFEEARKLTPSQRRILLKEYEKKVAEETGKSTAESASTETFVLPEEVRKKVEASIEKIKQKSIMGGKL